jgi:hypothetical protein
VREGDLQMEQEGSDPGEQQARGYSFLAYYPGTLSPEPHPSYFLLYFSATVSHFFFSAQGQPQTIVLLFTPSSI